MSVRKWIFLAAATVVVLAIVVAVVALLFLRSLSLPGEPTAKFMPHDTPLYVSFNFRPGPNQINLGKDVISLLKTDKLIEVRDDFLEDVEDETGVHLLDDTQSWLGTDVSFALLDDDVESPTWVMIAHVGDEDAALDFIDDLVSYIEDETGMYIDSSTYRNTDLWVAEDDSIAFGLNAEYLIAGDQENTVTRILKDIASPPERSLAQHPDFIAAQESMPEDRVMFLFAQTEDLRDLIVENVDLVDTGTALDGIEDSIPNYVAASASFIEKGMSLEIVADIPDEASDLSLGSGVLSPDALPADTLLVLAGTGITQGWDEGLDTLQDTDQEAFEAFEQALDDLEDETGIDVERDIIDALSGEIAFALLPSDIRLEDEALSGAVEALLLLGVKDPRRIGDTIDEATDFIEDVGGVTGVDDHKSINGYDVVTFSMDDVDLPLRINPGYMVTEDWAALGSTLESLEMFHMAASGAADSLRLATKFAAVSDDLPGPLHFITFADITGIADMVEEALTGDARRDYREEVKPFLEPFSALLLAYSVTDEEFRLTMRVSLQES